MSMRTLTLEASNAAGPTQATATVMIADAPPPVGLPAWVPPVGTVAAVNLNTPNDIDPYNPANDWMASGTFRGPAAVFESENGGAYCQALGPLGSTIHGPFAGHGDGGSTAILRYDHATQKWSMLKQSHRAISQLKPATGPWLIQPDNGHPIYDYDRVYGAYKDDGTPLSTHSYSNVFCMDKWLVLPGLNGPGVTQSFSSLFNHRIDLLALAADPTTRWERWGSTSRTTRNNTSNPYPQVGTIVHAPERNEAWGINTSWDESVSRLDCTTGEWTNYKDPTFKMPRYSYGTTGCYDPVSGMVLLLRHFPYVAGNSDSVSALTAFYPDTPIVHKTMTIVGALPPVICCAFTYCDANDTFYISTGLGNPIAPKLITLSRPTSGGDWNGTWRFGLESFAGTGPGWQGWGTLNSMWSKMHWIPAMRSLAHYGETTAKLGRKVADGPMWYFRPQGS